MLVHKWLNSYSPSSPTHSEHRQDIVSDFYLRPSNDTDRRKQKDRQQRLHYLLKHIWKGIYRANLIAPEVIVDWCCGIGVWDMEMATLFPQAQVIGVDFKEATLSNLQHECPNLKFRHVVIHTYSTGLESFDDSSVDFVMMRDVWFINAPPSKWINVLNESFRILKPGGWIEMSEHSLGVLSPGPCTHKVNMFFRKFFEDAGVEAAIAVKLNQFLEDTGFIKITKKSRAVPLGEWADTDELKLIGYLSKDWLERGLRNLSSWICSINSVSTQDISRLITASMEEELDEYRSYMEWTSYTARKPLHDGPQTPTAKSRPPTPPTDSSSICSKHS
ncbi:S-adenosyl-L-methionine-dependent methyltransferase [Mucor mucedo]|uniref:S-adenosyl-L-methionine-dependent methyltransferase n=1 Tax=Mucor mucedo TaxID=29922 RepID=UPI0022203396|nr:S-adenosyl-L-methionine-dependent methyltransferase [Mucor mucedo]KAI7876142.1 S-adenosyl-L-methionine-dependent methyltransferase [Mucor mucedo]